MTGPLITMSRRKPLDRCTACHMRMEICLCSMLDECKRNLKLSTRVVIIMHHRERFLTTNTARLAALSIPHCEIRMRGFLPIPFKEKDILEKDRQALLLYPSDDAVELNDDFVKKIEKPITLIVPDGSWRQASKVAKRESFLSDVPRVKLPLGAPSRYRLRREPKPHGLATFEAIARALGTLENKSVENRLNVIFESMVSKTMASRGQPLGLSEIACEVA